MTKRPDLATGILVQCVACHRKVTISFDDAADLRDAPMCEHCFMPMVVISATIKKGGRR